MKQRHVKLFVLGFIILAGAFVLYVLFRKNATASGTQTASNPNDTATPTADATNAGHVAFIPTTGDSFTTESINLNNSDNTLGQGATNTYTAPVTSTTNQTQTNTNQTISGSPGAVVNPPPTIGAHPPPPPVHHPAPPGPPHLPGPPHPSFTTYTVKAGDTLSAIARRYGLTWQQIYAYGENRATIAAWAKRYGYPVSSNPADNIFVGEPIQIPGSRQPV